ncbi:MFS transporter, partial [Enterococcus cecorum]|uniref:MFS transporter n=1 Tax=Enterococcus cecorum TaxID=44008 RepID=UPI001AD81D56
MGLALIYLFSSIIYPLETKILPKIVDKSQLVSANSLFQLAYKVLDISFNALATLFVAWFSLSVNFLLIFFTFFLATVMYRYFKIKADTITNVQSIATYHDYFQELLSGVRIFRTAPPVYHLFLPLAFVNFFYAISLVALPMFSKLYISSSSIGYGIVLMTSSLGGIAGAFFLNRLKIDIAKP